MKVSVDGIQNSPQSVLYLILKKNLHICKIDILQRKVCKMCAKCEFANLPIFFHILVELALRRILNTINGYFQASGRLTTFCKFAIVKEWSRDSQEPLEFKIRIFFLHNKIEDALGRILSTINVYLCAKMCEKQCKTCFFALARSSLHESIR